VAQVVDPAVNVAHQSDPVTLTREDGTEREVLIVTDERAGAAASAECPGGGLHLYDITGDLEQAPEKIGTWFIPAATVQDGSTCTSHVLRVYEDQQMLTIAWYAQGVRVLDISGLADLEGSPTTVGIGDGAGMREVGNYVLEDSDTWSFKTNRIAADGSFYGYGNDLVRGFDVYRFSGAGLSVPPLEPTDLGSRRPESKGKAMASSAVIIGPAMLFAAAVRRRTRQRP
jgi:hypothetical protein